MKRFLIIVCIIIIPIVLTACKHEHSWTDATCTAPKTCSSCGETEGESLGHIWKEATCTTSQICTRCQITAGSPLGHTLNQATCTTASSCMICGEVFGEPLGHIWIEATYDTPQTCQTCQLTDGEPLKREIPETFIDGFEYADIDRFSGYASDNGLGDTKIWIAGTFEIVSTLSVSPLFDIFYTMVTDDNGNQWLIELEADLYSPKETFTDLIGHPVCFIGRYIGYSDVMEAPALMASSIFDQKTGIIVLCQLYNLEYLD